MPPRRIVPTAVVDAVPASPPQPDVAAALAAANGAGLPSSFRLRAPGAAGDGARLRALAAADAAESKATTSDGRARRVYVRLGAAAGEDGDEGNGPRSGGGDSLPPGAVSATGEYGYKVDWKKILAARGLNRKKKRKRASGSGAEEDENGDLPAGVSAAAAARLGGGAGGVGGARRGGADIFSSVIERIERQYCFAGSSDEEEDEDDGEDEGDDEESSGSEDEDDGEEQDKGGSADGGVGDGGEKKKEKKEEKEEKKKTNNRGYQGDHYEYDDGFLDDSELARFHGGGGGDGSDGSDESDVGGVGGGRGSRKRKFGGFYICVGPIECEGEGEDEQGEMGAAGGEDDDDLMDEEDDDEGAGDDEERRGRGGGSSRKQSAPAAAAGSEKQATSLADASAAAGAGFAGGGGGRGRASTPSSPRPTTDAGAAPSGAAAAGGGARGARGSPAPPSSGAAAGRASAGSGPSPPRPPHSATSAEFVPPAGLARAVEDLRAAVEALPPSLDASSKRQIPHSLRDLIARVACQAERDLVGDHAGRSGKHWLSKTISGFMEPFTSRGNLTARLRVDGERANVDLRVSEAKLREGPAVSLPTPASADGALPSEVDLGESSRPWPAEVDAACDAFVGHWLVVHGGTRDGEGGKRAASHAAEELLGLGKSPAAVDAVLAAAGRGAAAREAEREDKEGGGGTRASADGGKARSPTPEKDKREPTPPPPPCPATERIVASAVEAGADRDTIERSLRHFAPGRAGLENATTIKAVVNKAMLHLGRRGGGVGDVVRAAIELGITGDPPWKEDNKSRKSHISTLLSSGGIGVGGSGGKGRGASESGAGGDEKTPTTGASMQQQPFFVQVAQRGNGFIYAHAAYPGLVPVSSATGGGGSRPSSSNAAPAVAPAAAPTRASDDEDFAAQLASVAAALADPSAPLADKLKVVNGARVEVIEELARAQPMLSPLLDALSKAKAGKGKGKK